MAHPDTAVFCQAVPVVEAGFDWSGLSSTLVAFLAFVYSLRAVAQGKRIEIQSRRFERLGIQPIESSFGVLDQLFQAHGGGPASDVLQILTERVADVNIVLSHIPIIYPAFDYADVVVRAGENFTDSVYAGSSHALIAFTSDYALWRMLVLDALYKALDKETGRWFRWKN